MNDNKQFPVWEVSEIAERESWRKEVNRPIYHIHKWWAQRLGSVFRAVLLYLIEDSTENIWDSYYKVHDYNNITVLDPFMGSGTTQAVAMKLGRKFIGADINLGSIQTTTKRLINVAKELDSQLQENQKYTGFEVYNVNNYDFFRNPLEARDLIIQALEIQPFPQSDVWDGELDGRMVKIMPVNRIATKADLEELKAKSESISSDKETADEIRNGLHTISTTGKGLLSFVENYRRFTRIPKPEPSLFYVKGFINRMVELARHQYPDSHITFHSHITPDDLILYADENLISQVLINLLKNAIQAIEAAGIPEGIITLNAYCNENEAVLIEVSNNGPAIPPEVAEHIFIPFFTTKEGGSGIGLSISRQIMRLSGGSLSLHPGKETMFVLKFN